MNTDGSETSPADSKNWCVVAPLCNFTSRIARLELWNDVVLDELQGEAKESFVEVAACVSMSLRAAAESATHCLATWRQVPEEQTPALGEAIDSFTDVITALRLQRPGTG